MIIDHKLVLLLTGLGNMPTLHQGGPVDPDELLAELIGAEVGMAKGLEQLKAILAGGENSPLLPLLATAESMSPAEVFAELQKLVADFEVALRPSKSGLLEASAMLATTLTARGIVFPAVHGEC